jgi:hypothetical protein
MFVPGVQVQPNQDEAKVASATRETRLDATRRTRDLTSLCHDVPHVHTHHHESMSSYSPGIPSSFDPALLYSELEIQHIQNTPLSASFSDDIEALQQCITEDTAKKTSEGIVIQHRAWNIAEIFRSEGEATIGTATSIPRHLLC